jgi:hypothetical protein
VLTEPNYGEDQLKNPVRRGTISGKLIAHRITFTKKYDTIPLITEFEDELSNDLRSVEGQYRMPDITGKFVMEKIGI